MSTTTITANAAATAGRAINMHRVRLVLGYALACGLLAALAAYGADYYLLPNGERPFSEKHLLLKPSGVIGLKLGFLGVACFSGIFLYAVRKRWPWLQRFGLTRHWLDNHVLLGLAAPVVIAFHAAFKFHGFAGIAFWIMLAVAISGIVGRYLYGQIPRSLSAAELSRRELQEMQEQLAAQLRQQDLLPAADLAALHRLPSEEQLGRLPALVALPWMMFLDAARVAHIAAMRRHVLGPRRSLRTLGGLLPSGHRELEEAIGVARAEASLAKRILFLDRVRQVFHLWHVVHKPFSYSFAVLAAIHVVVVMLLGFH